MNPDKVLWFALVFSTVIYAGIAYALFPNPEGSFEDAVRQQTTLIFYGLAVCSFLFGLTLPGRVPGPWRKKMIIAMGVFESCAIAGLVAAFLARDYRLFIPTWIIALLGMWKMYPSAEVSETAAGRARE
jgi:hypothetical protein